MSDLSKRTGMQSGYTEQLISGTFLNVMHSRMLILNYETNLCFYIGFFREHVGDVAAPGRANPIGSI